jgi:hypothetical protein
MSHLRRVIALVVLALVGGVAPLASVATAPATVSAASANPLIEPPVHCC